MHVKAVQTTAAKRSLLATTFLSTSVTCRLLASLFVAGSSVNSFSAKAADIPVSNDAELRNAITNSAPGDSITFTANITLTSALPPIAKNLSINGGNFTLSGDERFRGLYVASGGVIVNDLLIVYGRAEGGKGGSGFSGGGGGAGLGGALFVGASAVVAVSNVKFERNLARGGSGGSLNHRTLDSGGGGGMFGAGAGGDAGSFGGPDTGGRGGTKLNLEGVDGGFGGGGGGGGADYYRVRAGNGGFGGGGGGSRDRLSAAVGGFGGGKGDQENYAGGGGAGFGGAVFVQEGGMLALNGNLSIRANLAEGGLGGGRSPFRGLGAGAGIFLQGDGTLFVSPSAGQTQTINDSIADMTAVNELQFPNSGTAGSGRWTLIKNGTGTTSLRGINQYSGGTVVNGGVLRGDTRGLQGDIINKAIVAFDMPGDGTYAGNMSGGGALEKHDVGALRLTGANSYTGGTTVAVGILIGNTASLQGRIVNNATLVFEQPDDGTHAGQISGSGTLIKTGTGTLTLTGNNTHSGGTAVEAGSFRGNTASLQGNIGIGADASVVFDQAGSGIYAGNLFGRGTFRKEGPGELTLTGTNSTYSGRMEVTGGTLHVSSDGSLNTGTLSLNGGTLRVSETFRRDRPVVMGNLGGTISVDPGMMLTLSFVANESSLTKTGDGTLAITDNNVFDKGSILINGGTMQATTDSILGVANIAFASGPGTTVPRSLIFDQALDGGIRTTISGNGRLIKAGAGEVHLAGENSYSSGTIVSAGTLRGSTLSLQGDIMNSATVVFDHPNPAFDGSYAGSMTGSGQLIKVGAGRLSLTGVNSVGGGTTVNAGTLAVNNHLTSNVTVNKNGTLSGTGNITGNIIDNGGNIEPGNSIGNLVLNGNLTWNGGSFGVEVNANGASDRITVVGAGHKVTVNSGTLQVIPEAGTYVPNTRYTIITAPAGGIATFNSITGGVGFLTPALSFDDTNLYLSLVLAPNAFRAAGQTANQQAVGGALDAIAATGSVGGLITTMANLTPAQGASAFQALSPEPYADFGTVNTRSSQLFMNAVGRQMAGERGAAVGAPRGVALAETCDVACDDTAPRRFSAWLSGVGSLGSVLGNGNASGLTYTLGGTAFGIDYRLDPRFLVGIAGGYVGGSQWVNGFGGNGYTDSLSVALYGSFTQGGFYADALAGYANSSNRLQRVVAIPGQSAAIASGQTSANQFLGQLETGYKIGLPFPANTSISPFGRLQVGSVNQAAFSESGTSPFNLSVAQQTTTSVRTIFGADFGASFDMGIRRPLDVGLRLGWMHEFADTTRPISAAFAAAPLQQFTVFGATPQRDSAVIGFSATAAITDNASLFASYDGEVGGGTDNHALRVGFRMTW